jgi:hypothetical protein
MLSYLHYIDTTAMTIEQVEQEVAALERRVGRLKGMDA